MEGKEEIKHLYDVGRSLQNEFNPYRKHDAFYDFKTASKQGESHQADERMKSVRFPVLRQTATDECSNVGDETASPPTPPLPTSSGVPPSTLCLLASRSL